MSVTHPDLFAPRPGLLAALFGTRKPRAGATARPCGTKGAPPCGRTKASTCGVAAELKAERQRGEHIERALGQYVSPEIVERLMADPDGLSRGGETREVSVLFADIRGFTTLAEAMKADPRRLIDVVSAVLDPMTDVVLAHGGTIDKYMGDCVMAFWGAPLDDPDHARHACDAAQAMLSSMPEVNRRLRAVFGRDADLPEIEIGVGINSGECFVGNLGSRKRFDYSVLGDPVNVASRLQGLCKVYDAPLLVGEETARHLGFDPRLVQIDRIAVRGRTAEQAIFGLA